MAIYDPCSGSGGMLIYARNHVADNGGNPNNLQFGRPGEQRHHLVDLEDEHAAARHPRRRSAQQRHPGQPRARPRRRAGALRPGDHQPAVQPELRQGDAGPHRAVPLRLHPRGRQEGRPDVPAAHAGRAQARRDRRHRNAPRRAVPRRRRGRDPPPHHRTTTCSTPLSASARTCSTAPASPPRC